MGNLSLESFRNVAGTSASIGYVVADNKGELQKVAAHRHFMTGRNVAQTPVDSEANSRIRTQLFNAIRTAVVGTAAEASAVQRTFLAEIGKQLGITFKLGNDGLYDLDDTSQCVQTPLERRVLRAVLHETDVQIAADKVSCENAENARTQGANAKTVYRTVEASELPKAEQKTARMFDAKAEGFKKFSLADQKAVLEAFAKLRGAGPHSSAECVVNGKTVWLSRTNTTSVSVEFPSGKAISVDMNALNEKIADNVVANPKKAKAGELRAALNSVYVSPLQLRGPAPTRVREMAQKVLLSLCGPGTKLGGAKGLSEGDLLTVSPQRMRKLALEVLNGDYGTEKAFREGLGNAETRDLINSEEILKLADQFDAASEQEQEMVKTLGANAVKKPVSVGKSLLNVISGFFSSGKKEPAPQPKITAQDVKNLVADLIHDEDTIAMDRLHGHPGKQMAHTLGKHTDTLAALLCNPDSPALGELPAEYKTVVNEMLEDMRGNEMLAGKAVKGDTAGVKKLLDVGLSSGSLDETLKAAQKKIDEQTQHKFLYMQAAIKHGFAEMLKGGTIDLEAFANRLETEVEDLRESRPQMAESDLVDLASETLAIQDRLRAEDDKAVQANPSRAPKTEKALHAEALSQAEERRAQAANADPDAPAAPKAPPKDVARASNYEDLGAMMKAAGMTAEDIRKATVPPTAPSKTRIIGGKEYPNANYARQMGEYDTALIEYKELRLESSRKALSMLMAKAATDTTSGYSAFMVKVMNSYFGGMGVDDQRNMLAAGIRYMPSKEQIRENKMNEGTALLGAMLKGAGPIMQKMLQGLASTDCDPTFKAALKDMKSKLAPIPDNVVKANLLDMVKRSNGQILSIEVTKNLGAASVGQAFFCKVTLAEKDDRGNNLTKDVVVKMLRPDAEQRAKREADIFKEASKKVPGMEVTFAGQLASIMEELDLRIEAENTKQGVVYDKGGKQVSSMKVMDLIPPTRYTFVVEKAPGRTVDDLFDQVKAKTASAVEAFYEKVPVIDPETKQPKLDEKGEVVTETKLRTTLPGKSVAENLALFTKARKELSDLYETTLVQQRRLVTLAEKWCTQGIFDSGFYHGDLHAGNIMVDDEFARDEQGNLKRDENGNLVRNANGDVNGGLTVIDFGNATKLTEEQQKKVIIMMSAASVKNTDMFMEGFRALMTGEGRTAFDRQKNRIHDKLHSVFNLGTQKDSGLRIAVALQEMQKMGFELPAPIFKFSQCQMRLQGTIDEMNGLLENIQTAMNEFRTIHANLLERGRVDTSAHLLEKIFGGATGNHPSTTFKNALKYVRYRDNPPQPSAITPPDAETAPKEFEKWAKDHPEEHAQWRKETDDYEAYVAWKAMVTDKNPPPDVGKHADVKASPETLPLPPAETAFLALSGRTHVRGGRKDALALLEKSVRDLADEFDDPELVQLFEAARKRSDEVIGPKEREIAQKDKAANLESDVVKALSDDVGRYNAALQRIELQDTLDRLRPAKLQELKDAKRAKLVQDGLRGEALENAMQAYVREGGDLQKDFDTFLDKLENLYGVYGTPTELEMLRDIPIRSAQSGLDKVNAKLNSPDLPEEERGALLRQKEEFERQISKANADYQGKLQKYNAAMLAEGADTGEWIGCFSHNFSVNMLKGGKTQVSENLADDRTFVQEIEAKYTDLDGLTNAKNEAANREFALRNEVTNAREAMRRKGGEIEQVCVASETFAARYEQLMQRRIEKMQKALEPFEAHGVKRDVDDFTDAIGTVIGDNILASANKMGFINSVFRVKPKLTQAQAPT